MKGRRKKVVAELEDLFGLVFPKRAELKKAEKTEQSEKAEKAASRTRPGKERGAQAAWRRLRPVFGGRKKDGSIEPPVRRLGIHLARDGVTWREPRSSES